LVAAFGVGPLAGVITLALSTFGSLGKLFSEVNEEVDPRPLEGLEASGAGFLRKIRLGVAPQVLPNYASYALIRLEGNVAGAAAPQAMRPAWSSQALQLGLILLAVAALAGMMIDLDFKATAFVAGLGKLARLASTMIPPNDGGDLPRIVRALAETFAMAFA